MAFRKARLGVIGVGPVSEKSEDLTSDGSSDTPLTDVLLDQFAAYYAIAVLAVKALEEARRQRRVRESGLVRHQK